LVRNSSLHVIDNARHVPLLDNPEIVNDLIVGFIDGDSSPTSYRLAAESIADLKVG